MENIAALLIPALLGVLVVRVLLLPMRLVCKTAIYAGSGFLCLWLLNSASGFTGLFLPINAVTVLIAGILGVPGIGLIALLEVLSAG